MLAVAFREDDSRARGGHADPNLAVRRRLALALPEREGAATIGTKAKRLRAGWDDAYLLRVLAG